MIIIGDRLSAGHPSARGLMNNRDREGIGSLARAQARAGATHLLVHAGYFHFDEAARMQWLLEAAQEAAALPLAVDTPSPHAARAALKSARHGTPILLGVTAQAERLSAMGPVAEEAGCPVAVTLVTDKGVPEAAQQRVELAREALRRLADLGVAQGDVLLDPVFLPAVREPETLSAAVETVRRLREEFPQARILATIAGRTPLERAALTLAMEAGARAFQFSVLDPSLMGALRATRALLGLEGSHFTQTPPARA